MSLVRRVQLWDFQQLLHGKFFGRGPFNEDLAETPRGKLIGREIAGGLFGALVMVRSDQDWKFKAPQRIVFGVPSISVVSENGEHINRFIYM